MPHFRFHEKHGDLIGAHISTKGGLHTVFERASLINASAIALFAKSSSQWKGKVMTEDDVALFAKLRNVKPILTHASYLINLASTNEEVHRKSIDGMADELDRAVRLGAHAVVLHPGAHLGAGVGNGVDRVARSLDRVHALLPEQKVVTLLETAAGQGSYLGCTFEELGRIIDLVDEKRRVGICIDTCHIFAAGYDIRTRDGWERAVDEIETHVGIARVGAFHLNDSKKPLGSRVDRHENIGEGEIGVEGFRHVLNDVRFRRIPKLIETPKKIEHESDRKNLRKLRGLLECGGHAAALESAGTAGALHKR